MAKDIKAFITTNNLENRMDEIDNLMKKGFTKNLTNIKHYKRIKIICILFWVLYIIGCCCIIPIIKDNINIYLLIFGLLGVSLMLVSFTIVLLLERKPYFNVLTYDEYKKVCNFSYEYKELKTICNIKNATFLNGKIRKTKGQNNYTVKIDCALKENGKVICYNKSIDNVVKQAGITSIWIDVVNKIIYIPYYFDVSENFSVETEKGFYDKPSFIR